jgi:hypothetical protein
MSAGVRGRVRVPEMTDRNSIDGIKLSNELVRINLRSHAGTGATLSVLCRTMASNRINMPFLSTACLGGDFQVSCCVAIEDGPLAKAVLEADAVLKKGLTFVRSVGLLSIFPHRSSLGILGLSLYALGKARLPLYGVASSLSALTFITDYARLEEAAASLEEVLRVPPGQRPFRPRIRVRQSPIPKEERP